MKRFINMGSIDQFRTVTKNLQRMVQYQGQDENGKAVYDKNTKMPIITAIGTEKIHGTNAAVCYSNPDGFWVQSRKNIITPEKDNAGCAFQAYANESAWGDIINKLAGKYDIDLRENIISIYFEWSGGNIQKKSALSGLNKRAMIFQYFKVSPIEPQTENDGTENGARWLETSIDVQDTECGAKTIWVDNPEKNIFNIMNFQKTQIEIDFNQPLMAQNKMIEMVEAIEKNSPVGQSFGVAGNTGEGYVFTFEYKGVVYRFKVKGEEHAKGSGKVKTLKPVDEELENKKIKFVNEVACQEFRLDQMFTEIQNSKYNGNVMEMSNKDIGDYLRLVVNDVIKEHSDVMLIDGLEPKMVNGMISKVARGYFMDRLDKEQM